jgi:hypothetical protein
MYRFILISLVLLVGSLIAYDHLKCCKNRQDADDLSDTRHTESTEGDERSGDDAVLHYSHSKSYNSI